MQFALLLNNLEITLERFIRWGKALKPSLNQTFNSSTMVIFAIKTVFH